MVRLDVNMQSLYLFIPIGIIVMIIAVVAFIFTIRSGQYDDLDGDAFRILMDDDDPRIPNHETESSPEDTTKKNKN